MMKLIYARPASIDIMAKSMKLAWIPRLLSEEENFEDSWKAIPNYPLLDKFGGLHSANFESHNL